MTMNMLMREQKNIGENKKLVSLVRKNRLNMSDEQMADIFDVDIEIVNMILDHPEMDDEEIAELLIDFET